MKTADVLNLPFRDFVSKKDKGKQPLIEVSPPPLLETPIASTSNTNPSIPPQHPPSTSPISSSEAILNSHTTLCVS